MWGTRKVPVCIFLLMITGAFLLPIFGCEKRTKAVVEVVYREPAKVGMPEGLDAIAFIPFTQAIEDQAGIYTSKEKKWGDVIVASIAQKMQEYSRKFDIPLNIVEREAVSSIMKEKDLADVGLAEENQALQLGKVSKAQAVCFGKLVIDIKTIKDTAKTIGFHRSGYGIAPHTEHKQRVKRTIAVAATVKLVATATDKSILTFTRKKSDTIDKKPSAILGSSASEADLQPENDIILQLINKIVDDFVAQLMPHEVRIRIRLAGVQTKSAESGIKVAKVGDYDEAMELFRDGVRINPEDHGAMYNLGVMYEVKRQAEESLKWYKKAYQIKDKDMYLKAVLRMKKTLKAE